MTNKMAVDSVAVYTANFLQSHGVRFAHYLSGGMIAFLVDAFIKQGIKMINYRHEQSAGFAAEGETRVTGIPSVALGTSGPGATNLITAIASCYFDSTPVIFITGQVNTNELKSHLKQRQNGFQELDIVNLCKGITKLAVSMQDPDELPSLLDKAWETALEGRKGPVLIDIPIDTQQIILEEKTPIAKKNSSQITARFKGVRPTTKHKSGVLNRKSKSVSEAVEVLAGAKKPIVLVGGGVRLDDSVEELREFLTQSNLPVVSSLMGLDAPNQELENFVGFIGSYGNRWANRALYQSDALLVLGSRLDIRQTGSSVSDFSSNKQIIRVDVDPWELRGRVRAQINFQTEIKNFLSCLSYEQIQYQGANGYLSEIVGWRRACENIDEQVFQAGVNPILALKEIANFCKDSLGYFVDVGQHQMWAAQSLSLKKHQRFITSGGLGSMGFAVPSAIGATLSTEKPWIVITGDGCAQLSLPELQTLRQHKLPVLVYILNNQQHGMVAQFQEEYLSSNFIGTKSDYTAPNFSAVASSFGLRAMQANSLLELLSIHNQLLGVEIEPTVIEIMVSSEFKALPKLGGKIKLSDM